MKLAVMQPYFFPYIGYYQLIKAVDTFVIYDDVNYIMRGWINRNYILFKNKPHLFVLSLIRPSQNKIINEIMIQDENENSNRKRVINIVQQAYNKAPQFKKVFPIIEEIVLNKESNLNRYLRYSLKIITDYVGIDTEFINSSDIEKDNTLKGEAKILEICKRLKTDEYINLIGGRSLYRKEEFGGNNIKLSFIRTKDIQYKQFKNGFVPNLSLIDILMFCSVDEMCYLLKEYEIE